MLFRNCKNKIFALRIRPELLNADLTAGEFLRTAKNAFPQLQK
ncbi:Uncharacterized protein dnm_099850 [Desulfonema magnum]|uniref:Uncharacterized protein n=1 Tax=Desulfonema magnum TaxID=45655 RepID=A0A975BZJ3_9BACT|nr:Uncharacterized protein dnm_099810 [Desulfonema magnum]QTA93874.1 Uncharacterized protein dnm_099820 [Desulfonema magnum]QTA93875.1 Uncharacterized protein dnm_099830 [Desulfonema magnum]QTA93876.1 Uncharacterized protein dnm_099840 [Desulfonema magnum]QTA93877.1 Uncharacterized protein dnm_099850 [Desulfonema magnum]